MTSSQLNPAIDAGVAFVREALNLAVETFGADPTLGADFLRSWQTIEPLEYQASTLTAWSGARDTAFREAVAALPSARAFVESLEDTEAARGQLDNMVGTDFGDSMRLQKDSQLVGLVSDCVRTNETFDFDDDAARAVVTKLVLDLAASDIDVRMLIPIRGLAVEAMIDLPHGSTLRPLEEEETFLLLNIPGALPDFPFASPDGTWRKLMRTDSYCVATTITLPKRVGEPDRSGDNPLVEKANDLARDARLAVTAARLGWEGGAALGPRIQASGTWRTSPYTGVHFGPPVAEMSRSGEQEPRHPPIEITSEHVADYREILDWVDKGHPRMDIPLERFRQVATRPNPTDRLIDLFIAAEGLFFEGSVTEIQYKLALRAALGTTGLVPYAPRDVFDFLRDAYGIRSKVVHGEAPISRKRNKWPTRLDGTKTDQISDLAVDMEELMRIALLDWLRGNADGDPPDYDTRVGEFLNVIGDLDPDSAE